MNTLASPVARQVYASMGTTLLFVVNGYIIGLQAVLLPQLRAEDSPIQLDLHQESWINSVPFMVIFPAQTLCGALTYKLGRKKVLLLSVLPTMITSIMIYISVDYWSLLLTFIIFGAMGGGISVGTLMIAEMCSPQYRCAIMNVKTACMSCGILLAHFLGNYYNYRTLTLFGLIPSTIGLISITTSPESPAWLAAKGKFTECEKAFVWLRGNGEHEELYRLINSQKIRLRRKRLERNENNNKSLKSIIKYVFDRTFLKAMGLSIAFIIMIDFAGKQVFNLYAVDAITNMLGSSENSYLYATAIDAAEIITLSLSCFVVNRFKMRTLLFGLGIPALTILFTFCFTSYSFSIGWLSSDYRWTTLVMIVIYFSLLNIAVIPCLFAMLSEVCPLSHRELGLAVTSFFFISMLFTMAKLTPFILKYCDIYGTFLINGTFMSMALLYLYFFLPETNKKTLQEIEENLKGEALDSETMISVEMKECILK